MKRIYSISLISLVMVLMAGNLYAASSIAFPFLLSENRQYDTRFNLDPVWSQTRYFMIAGGEILREGEAIPRFEFLNVLRADQSEYPWNILYRGNYVGLMNCYANGFLTETEFGAHAAPDQWENSNYTFHLYNDAGDTVIDTQTVSTASIDFEELAIPEVTIDPGTDPLHPTINWNAVQGANEYRVQIFKISCADGMPVFFNPLYVSEGIAGNITSHKIPDDVDAIIAGPVAIWVQARKINAQYGPTGLVSRGSYYAWYSPYEALASDDLQNGWTIEKDPVGSDMAFTAGDPNQLSISVTAPNENDDNWGKYQKSVEGLRGIRATFNMSGPAIANGHVGLRKNVVQKANGNIVKAEFRLQVSETGWGFIRYRVREYQKDSWNEVDRMAEGNLGHWYQGEDITLTISFIDDLIVLMADGAERFCGPVTIPVMDNDYSAISGNAEIIAGAWYQPLEEGAEGTSQGSISATVKDVKFIMDTHIPDLDDDIPGDSDENGILDVRDAIRILQTTSGISQ
jgi:hypothetical protein